MRREGRLKNDRKLYEGKTRSNSAFPALYQRYLPIIVPAVLYLVLGSFQQIPFLVFQVLFLVEGIAFLQDGFKSSLRYSNVCMGLLCLLWVIVSSLRTSLASGYTVTVSNQVTVCNLIYIVMLGVMIYQIHQRQALYFGKWDKICIGYCIVAIAGTAFMLVMIEALYFVERFNWEITDFVYIILEIGARILAVVQVYPVAEWLLQGAILLSVLTQSPRKFAKHHTRRQHRHEEQ